MSLGLEKGQKGYAIRVISSRKYRGRKNNTARKGADCEVNRGSESENF